MTTQEIISGWDVSQFARWLVTTVAVGGLLALLLIGLSVDMWRQR